MKTNDYDFRVKVLDQLESGSMPPKVFPSFICPLCEAKVFTASFNLLSINHYVKPSCLHRLPKLQEEACCVSTCRFQSSDLCKLCFVCLLPMQVWHSVTVQKEVDGMVERAQKEERGGERKKKYAHWSSGVQCTAKGCGKMVYSRCVMEDHMRKAHGAEKLSCPRPDCEKEFLSFWGFKCHLRRHDKDIKRVTKRTGKALESEEMGGQVDMAEEKVDMAEEKWAIALRTRVGTDQRNTRPTETETYEERQVEEGAKSVQLSKKRSHRSTSTVIMKDVKEKYCCNVEDCCASYARRGNLVSHMKKIHGGGAANRTWPSLKLSYRCKAEECGAMFTTRPYLMRHIEVFHDGKEEGDVSMM